MPTPRACSPPACLPACLPGVQGLALVYKSKMGLLLGVESEAGFVIARLEDPECGHRWSAPVFVQGRSWCAGLTLGERAAALRRGGAGQADRLAGRGGESRAPAPRAQATAARGCAWRS